MRNPEHLLVVNRPIQWNLSPRELEVLDLLALGLSYIMIGKRLNISPHTVKTHVEHICKKMPARNRLEAVAKYGATSNG